jgi:CheY-like chemotaxis protein/predicted  nucleic acid-binding Zn-ribbon protein
VPDSSDLSSALGATIDDGRQFLARVESLAGSVAAELAKHEQAGRDWAAERQTLTDQGRQLREQIESLNASLASVRDTVRKLEQERMQLTADRDQIRQAREAVEHELGGVREKLQAAERETARFQAELASSAAEIGKVREQLAMVTKDRDTLQADQIQWGLDREQLLAEQARLKERVSGLETDFATERAEFEALQGRHAELTEQSNKLAADWAARRQALAAEIAAQNEEMEQVRRALQSSQERERRVVAAPISAPAAALSSDLSHVVNSRLNTLVGFSSVLLDERSNPLSAEERREYVKYLHDSAVKLGEAIRSLSGSRPASADSRPAVVDPERRPPDILVADNDQASRQRIEPFLKRAGYEVVYVESGPRALEKASHLQPLAILIDASLPPSGAATLVRELRKDPRTREVPMVLLTSPSGPPLAIAECEVLTKPIDRQQLVQLMVRFDLMADSKRARKMPANVLVIDDDPQAVSLVKAILKPFNVRVTAVDSGRSGIEHALRNKPDLVILDLLMPDIDGFEVVASLRRDKEMTRVPILIHTAKPLTADDRQRLDGKVESIVEKAEFQPERFLELLLKRGERRKRAA